ncbi:efflux RND transporter periplasmic adaptor subunit [Cupriavidus sp. 30B13]|uniref:efflux RND transporter periplasmic adaptor subunit n=1 Tax=Cupriavidus sp. 30B13 TaxID=3384241 RepID=UPI003B90A130
MAMNSKQKTAVAVILAGGALAGAALIFAGRGNGTDGHGSGTHAEAAAHDDNEHHGASSGAAHDDAGAHGDGEHHAGSAAGPNGGQLFRQGDAAVEVLVGEAGPGAGGARLRLWASRAGKPLAPASVKAAGELRRLTGESERLAFVPAQAYLQSAAAVGEPHAFEASLEVTLPGAGAPLAIKLRKEEGLVEMTPAQIQGAGLTLQAAGPARIEGIVSFPGEIRFNEDRTAHVVPRVAGVVEGVAANLGQQVRKGDLLAVLASTALSDQRSELLAAQKRLELAETTFQREKTLWQDKISAEQDYLAARTALQEARIAAQNAAQKLTAIGASGSAGNMRALNRFELRAPFDGTVVEKHLALGEALAADANVFTISDLGTVWAEFVIAPKDLDRVRVGEKVRIASTAFDGKAEGTVSYVGSLLGQQTRTATARVTLANPKTAWRPGLFVTVGVTDSSAEVPVAIDAQALQSNGDQQVVFVAVPGGFLAQPVKTGRSDGKLVEITQGMRAGWQYVAGNSFMIKAELGKAGAEHSH